jgi:ribulose-bisphosphate carboxylase large chain
MEKPEIFRVTYQIATENGQDAERIAQNICIEQSVEMPPDVVPGHVKGSVARLESITQTGTGRWKAVVAFPSLLTGDDPTQLLNVIFGNSSLQPGIKVLDVEDSILSALLPGPSFGIEGIRDLLDIHDRPLSCTALKPIGLSPEELAERAFQFASGGIDIIKDDHGLTSQESADFTSRVTECSAAIRRGEQKSGKRTLYFPNITCSPAKVLDQYWEALDLGADGVLIAPQLTGPELLCEIARDASVPVMAHPAFSGTLVIHETRGLSAPLYYGKLWRAFGADCIIYPNARGRFTFTLDLCKAINQQCRSGIPGIRPAFPTPGGGINRDTVSGWVKEYENDTIFLIGGSLYQHPGGLEAATIEFHQRLTDGGIS